MIDRQMELGRRHHRKKKMRKLKTKLGTATGADRDAVLAKIKKVSPWWTEASLAQKAQGVPGAPPAEKKEKAAPKPKADPKGPPKPRAEKADKK